ncbi:hypothetical protein DE146DRAFT_776413 [Phaeosphaeria sp. MPI-PUGE-AT-0046c]|nr:hypothetical protein DE146DRAFT_776413 [Phaeosphaeria sp. MPI-PUGE-AT-0046c]
MATHPHHLAGWDVWHRELVYEYKGHKHDPVALPPATPVNVLLKYTGTFRSATAEEKVVTIELRKQMLHLTQGAVGHDKVKKEGEDKKGGKDKVQGRSRVTKNKAATRTARMAVTSLAAAMAGSKAGIWAAAVPAPQSAMRAIAVAAPAVVVTTTPVFLNSNGVPQIRISGATKEETEMNEELQGVGRLGSGEELVSFDVRKGEVVGVRVGGELYVRVGERS